MPPRNTFALYNGVLRGFRTMGTLIICGEGTHAVGGAGAYTFARRYWFWRRHRYGRAAERGLCGAVM